MKASALLLATAVLVFCFTEAAAFISPASVKPALNVPRTRTALDQTGGRHRVATTLAGNLWPSIRKFRITPTVAKEIAFAVREITDWQDILLLSLLAFGASPLAKLTFDRLPEEKKGKLLHQRKRFGVSSQLSQIGKLALSVYAVDVISVVLNTLGFHFPIKYGLSAAYAKVTYTCWALQRFMVYKRLALCKFYKVDEEDMGRVEIVDRLLNGISIGLVALLLFDWLSVRCGVAVKGVFAFGSVGTLAFTLGSQKLVAQVRLRNVG
jgi:hypothetical protein